MTVTHSDQNSQKTSTNVTWVAKDHIYLSNNKVYCNYSCMYTFNTVDPSETRVLYMWIIQSYCVTIKRLPHHTCLMLYLKLILAPKKMPGFQKVVGSIQCCKTVKKSNYFTVCIYCFRLTLTIWQRNILERESHLYFQI